MKLINFYVINGFDLTVIGYGSCNDSDMIHYCQQRNIPLFHYDDVAGVSKTLKRQPFRIFQERKTLKQLVSSLQPNIIVASVGDPGLFLGHMNLINKSIYILHTSPEYGSDYSAWKRYITRKLIRLILVPRKCCFVTVSQYASRKMRDNWGLSGSRQARVIYNCSEEIVALSSALNKSVKVLTVGHVVDYKNPLFWIEIARHVLTQIPDIKFTWIGPGPLLDACREHVKDLRLEKNIEFIGALKDLNSFYAESDIYLQPSKIENLSISVLDAMRYGMPSVVSNRGGLPEVVQDSISGFVLDLDEGAEKFAQRIVNLAKDQESRMRMGLVAQNTYSEKFSPARWDIEMLTMHAEILR
jgi:glycosyltransferase involved in cell wall biosynthesis